MEFDLHVMSSKNMIILPNVLAFNLVVKFCQPQNMSPFHVIFANLVKTIKVHLAGEVEISGKVER